MTVLIYIGNDSNVTDSSYMIENPLPRCSQWTRCVVCQGRCDDNSKTLECIECAQDHHVDCSSKETQGLCVACEKKATGDKEGENDLM